MSFDNTDIVATDPDILVVRVVENESTFDKSVRVEVVKMDIFCAFGLGDRFEVDVGDPTVV